MKIKGLFFAALALSMVVLAGCNKKLDTIAKIVVYDGANHLVPDCRVVLWGQASNSPEAKDQGDVVVYDTAYTNTVGEAVFYFNDIYKKGQAGVAILNISAKKGTNSGSGIIKIEEQTTTTEKVFIHP